MDLFALDSNNKIEDRFLKKVINFSLAGLGVTVFTRKIGRHVREERVNVEGWKNEIFFKAGSDVEII